MKLLVKFDLRSIEARSSDFLVPWYDGNRWGFRGLKSGREATLGMLVFVGRPINENDLFAKLVNLGTTVSDVDATLELLRSYVEQLQFLKIGNIVRLTEADAQSDSPFDLELVAKSPSGMKGQQL